MSRELSDLEYQTRVKAEKAMRMMNEELKKIGYDGVFIAETKRSLAVQMAYYSRGRMEAADVKRMYAAAGLYNPSEQECKTPNTWTLNSNHISGHAVDFVPVKGEKIQWNAPEEVWNILGECGKKAGLKWGGDWQQKDYPHFED